jgi:hypothetical protein
MCRMSDEAILDALSMRSTLDPARLDARNTLRLARAVRDIQDRTAPGPAG